MSLFEKSAILGSIGFVGCFSLYAIFNPSTSNVKKEDIQKKRERILQEKDMRILYSTMTFFYLQGFEQSKARSFFLFKDILEVAQPKIIALQLSENEYEKKYQKVINNPKFPDAMNRIERILKNKDEEKLLEMENEIELENLEKLYAIDYCKKNKCQILFGDRSRSDLMQMYDAKLRLQKLAQEKETEIPTHLTDLYQKSEEDSKKQTKQSGVTPTSAKTSSANKLVKMSKEEIENEIFKEYRQSYFVDRLMDELKPKYSLMPQNPYKTIIGLVEPEHVNPIAKKWKENFRTVYGHEIVEDESVADKYKDE